SLTEEGRKLEKLVDVLKEIGGWLKSR
ncbi:TPA: transcriptional regulator, partial [Acinetobacter baumannii]